MQIQKYHITNKNIQGEIKSYSLSDIIDSTNYTDEYLEFYLNTPHYFINGEKLNVNFKAINLSNNSVVYLRPGIMIGVALAGKDQEETCLWCYETDTTEWYEIDNNGILVGYRDHIDTYEDEDKGDFEWVKSFRTFRIEKKIDNGILMFKEYHSDKWTPITEIDNIRIECGKYSGLVIAYACVIPDTYFRIPYIELRRDINIIAKWWGEDGFFYVKTDYNYNYDEKIWLDKLTEDDIDGRVICIETSDKQYYVPQKNVFDEIPLNKLFKPEKEFRIPYKNILNTYYDIPIKGVKPCDDADIEYTIILENAHNIPKFSGVQRIRINCRGKGYSEAPTIIFNGGGGTGAEAYTTVKDGMIMDIVMTNTGEGYVEAPTITFSGGGGVSAMATAILYKDEFDNIENMFLLFDLNHLTFYKYISGISINFNLEQDFSLKTLQSELVNTKFIEVETQKAINPILDNERIRFEPVYRDEEELNNKKYYVYYPINRIVYEFYFLPHGATPTRLYDLGFIDSDVQQKKKGLSKTFCRQSFFDNRNPTIQRLEYFSSIYVNIDKLFANYALSVNTISGQDPNNSLVTVEKIAAEFHVFNPLLEKFEVVYNKGNATKETKIEYIQTSSSEGYYIHLFGQEYRDLIPDTIYMKTEFNNAKSGKRTLFFNRKHSNVPMNNIFFDKLDNLGKIETRQHLYTDITVTAAKVKWNIVDKRYEENLDDFELKYMWFPNRYENVVWGENGGKDEKDKLTIKFYEAHVDG